jgi:hypothetical protein
LGDAPTGLEQARVVFQIWMWVAARYYTYAM